MINPQVLPCFISSETLSKDDSNESVALILLKPEEYEAWLRQQDEFTFNWLLSNNFKPQSRAFTLIPNTQGKLSSVLSIYEGELDVWAIAHLATGLPVGYYHLESSFTEHWHTLALGWGLQSYYYDAFKPQKRAAATLVIPEAFEFSEIKSQLQAIYLVRDLINTPAENMGPEELSNATQTLAQHYQAQFKETVGKELINENYPAIYMVGRGSIREPRLLEFTWGEESHPKLTLVGKGVCFDTGGLDLKTADGMILMKKDMGGAAHALGLASMIMDSQLPVRLRVLIPTVDNAISDRCYRPGDVIHTRKGLTVEVGNTDAEGRLILADALYEASKEAPNLLIDFATLTGAARVAVGTDIAALFSNNLEMALELLQVGKQVNDPVWPLPLHQPYKEMLDSTIADLNNNPASGYAGASTAALFLESFIENKTPWLHFDVMAYNLNDKPGRPKGGEALALRAVFEFIVKRFSAS